MKHTCYMRRADFKVWIARCRTLAPYSDEAFYATNGRLYRPEPFSDADTAELRALLKGPHTFKPGECFMNAARLALWRDEFTYCEGMAAGYWPVLHAWVMFKGRPVDVTWPVAWREPDCYRAEDKPYKLLARVEYNIENSLYLGVEIPTERLRDLLLNLKSYAPLARQHLSASLDKNAEPYYNQYQGRRKR